MNISILKNKKDNKYNMVLIKLSFNKFERNKKMSLQFIPSSSSTEYEFIEDEEFKGKYCKEKLNKIIEYEKKL